MSFGVEAYPILPEHPAVLLAHLANNHPLPDANKRAAFRSRVLDANGLTWRAPDIEIDAGMVESIAADEAAHAEIVDWIRERTREEGDGLARHPLKPAEKAVNCELLRGEPDPRKERVLQGFPRPQPRERNA